MSILWWIGLTAVFTFVLLRTRFGNWIFASGGDPSRRAIVGVPVARVKIALFILTAVAATIFAAIQVLRRARPIRCAAPRRNSRRSSRL